MSQQQLDEARTLALQVSEADFAKKYATPVFVLKSPLPPPAKSAGFRTGVLDTALLTGAPGATSFFVIARKDGKQMLSIAIGRTPSCDVQLDSPAVSKLHAMMQFSAPKGGFILTDNDSSNGTWVNDLKLAANQPQLMSSGDAVDFGHAFRGNFYEPAAFYQFLRQP